ncbi:FAD:protein FMN transferase [Exiguobacterium oxidotolerans]|uniref:FAD:protein FMN transferase n=1 Tax=Exiguobacterium oxidotolerans TaxID=223958 RepID=A0A653I8J1_9BACL|nr:FAD:protein FMN transferase [Exiguobacterium oxidotolerans]VWX35323.1 FAD:protein FMN transferase [Exiguobacterium oxidotolerans]
MERQLYSMHNTIRFVTENQIPEEEWQEIERFFSYVDREWSRFAEASEVNRLNRLRIGETLSISLPLARLLKRSIRYFEQTEHYFSPFLLEQQQANGYRDSFPFHYATESERVGPPEITPFILEGLEVTRVGGGAIDLGGIGKGAAAMMVAQRLRKERRRGLIEAGGDVVVWSDETPWKIGVTHPHTDEEIAEISLRQGAIATSNRIYRSWHVGERMNHHLLDGKTGRPIETPLIQVTASAPQLYEAEVMTKLAFQMTEQERQEKLFKWFPNGRLLLLDASGEILSEKKGECALWTG